MKKKTNDDESGILLLAKKSGKTSFSSLSSVKHALGTGKVGHTGTLDSFADGLLVVLTGKLTHLVPHITGFSKTYLALIEFGSETDTLDPTGQVVKIGEIPSEEDVRASLEKFTGTIDQIPPLYSALHVNGKRASDLAREGKIAEIPARKITIHSISLLDFYEKYALIEVHCSKGTYIRSLARDIAAECGTCAHLLALRRTSVGPFSLKNAVGAESLEKFTISAILARKDKLENPVDEKIDFDDEKNRLLRLNEHLAIQNALLPMTAELSELCGLSAVILNENFVDSYRNGKPLTQKSFDFSDSAPDDGELAVFYPDRRFAGIVQKKGRRFSYGFVIPPRPRFCVYSWDDVVSGKFCKKYLEQGTALTIGSFDGPHIGHNELFESVLSKRKCANPLVPGVITFKKSLRGFKHPDTYAGDVASLSQRLAAIESKGFAFAVVIDFSPEFGKIIGTDFLSMLIKFCGMKFLAEGKDFHCGYKSSTDMAQIEEFGNSNGFDLETIAPVFYGEEKVSSSRIRKCVLDKDFKSAKYMLERPFMLDCSDFEWQKSFKDSKKILTADVKGVQVVPPSGEYKVLVIMSSIGHKSGEAHSAESVRAYRSDCTFENRHLHLAFSDELISGFVRSIQFDAQ